MKKRIANIVVVVGCLCLIFLFYDVEKKVSDELRILSNKKEVLKEYICEQIGFGGEFTLTLYENGTFSYYEGVLSSYIGDGDWVFEDKKLTLLDKGTGKIRKSVFDYENGDLIYNQQESDQHPFTYVQLEDGKRFITKEKVDDILQHNLERQLEEQGVQLQRKMQEATEEMRREDYLSLRSFEGVNVRGTLYIDAWEHAKDEQSSIRVRIENRDDKCM